MLFIQYKMQDSIKDIYRHSLRFVILFLFFPPSSRPLLKVCVFMPGGSGD